MLDTNVLISAVYNPTSVPGRTVELVGSDHCLVLCEYVIKECLEVIQRKFPHRLELFNDLLNRSGIEVFVGDAPYSYPISDPKDQPILDAAVAADVDVLVSGDKHFVEVAPGRPNILTPARFLEEYGHVDAMSG